MEIGSWDVVPSGFGAEVRREIAAAAAVARAKARRDANDLAASRRELATVVHAARDEGVSWQQIGDALGMRRGAAYQRFRHRPFIDA